MQIDQTASIAAFLRNLSIVELNSMQQAVILKAATGSDILLLAPTGTGKTLAFLIPLVNTLTSSSSGVQALIVVPSRELALQIESVFRLMKTSFNVSCCYGGHAMKTEQNSLQSGPAVVIGTPGRLADHIKRKSFDARAVKMVVLDEFDKSLQMGFHEPLRLIFKALGGKQQYILTSASNLNPLPDFLPFAPEVLSYLKELSASRLQLKHIVTSAGEKVDTLLHLVAGFNGESCVVFCNHREAVERISAVFGSYGVEHGILHGAMEQIDREKNLIKFRGGANHVLIATDLAARGLDIPSIKHIVHYQLPPQQVAFLHRNGRTARMNAEGISYLVLADDEQVPDYINGTTEPFPVAGGHRLPPAPTFTCLYISAGKKDKVSKGDIAGLLMKKGGLSMEEIGLIATLDYSSYVCIRRPTLTKVLENVKNERLKNIKVKIELAS